MCGGSTGVAYFDAIVRHDKEAADGYPALYRFNTERSRWQSYDSYLNGWVNAKLGGRKIDSDERMGRNQLRDWDELYGDESRIVKYDTTWADAEYVTDAQIEARYNAINEARHSFENEEYLGDFGNDGPFEFDEF